MRARLARGRRASAGIARARRPASSGAARTCPCDGESLSPRGSSRSACRMHSQLCSARWSWLTGSGTGVGGRGGAGGIGGRGVGGSGGGTGWPERSRLAGQDDVAAVLPDHARRAARHVDVQRAAARAHRPRRLRGDGCRGRSQGRADVRMSRTFPARLPTSPIMPPCRAAATRCAP